jgi:hypothetical protein
MDQFIATPIGARVIAFGIEAGIAGTTPGAIITAATGKAEPCGRPSTGGLKVRAVLLATVDGE